MGIVSSLTSWLGQVITLRDGKFWGGWYGGETWAGRPVSEVNSLNLSAWWRATRLYADVTGALPSKVFAKTSGDDRVDQPDHELALIMSVSPNGDQTPQEFWGGMAANLAVFGNTYAEKQFSGKRLVSLDQLPYDVVPDRSRNSDRRLEYRYYDRGKVEWLPRDKVFHVRGFTLGKSDVGMSPLAAARQALSIALATEESAGKTFSHGMRMSGFFTGPRLGEDQRKDFTEKFIDPIVGNDAQAHYGILEQGFEFKPINIPPKDAEMLLSRRFNVEEIARFMGVPPIMVGHNAEGQTAWGTGVEAIINMWLTLGYNSFLRYFESSINRWLISPEDRGRIYVEFNRNALLRMDSQARAEFITKMISAAQMTPNEGRKTDNRPPMPDGDQLFINSTYVPISKAGEKAAQQATPALPAPGEEP